MKQKKLNHLSFLPRLSLRSASTLLSAAVLSACGAQAFVPSTNNSNQSAGNMNIPPKVDIVMGISMNGTMKNIYPGLQTEIPAFAQNLENSGWDYRFVTIPLSEYMPGSTFQIPHAVSVSHYSTNYPQGQWLPPYPGASYTDPLLKLAPSLFSYTFVFPGTIDAAHNDGHETGVKNEVDFISRSDIRRDFLRPDALLAIISVSNGEDRSGGTWVPAWNGYQWQAGSNSSLPNFEMNLINIKGAQALVKYYSLVAHLTTTCRGYGTWSGQRYEQIAADLGGLSIDICTNPLSSSLDQVAQHLKSQKLNFVRRYLVIGNQPNVATIKVTKYFGGIASNAMVIPQDAANGWTYAGYFSTPTYTIESPAPMDLQTGYFIELHGSAKLHGEDSANVDYTNAGTAVSH